MLAIITKMTLTQVSTWFANARRRLKKENKMTWEPRNRVEDEDNNNDDDDSGRKSVDEKDRLGKNHGKHPPTFLHLFIDSIHSFLTPNKTRRLPTILFPFIARKTNPILCHRLKGFGYRIKRGRRTTGPSDGLSWH